jgi:hypothetical protein
VHYHIQAFSEQVEVSDHIVALYTDIWASAIVDLAASFLNDCVLVTSVSRMPCGIRRPRGAERCQNDAKVCLEKAIIPHFPAERPL